jgi:hypothetical protein
MPIRFSLQMLSMYSDMLSLGLPPLHIAPFFLYSNPPTTARFDNSMAQEQYYEVPHWMHLSFVSYESDEAVFVDHLFDPKERKRDDDEFAPRRSGMEIGPNGFLHPSCHDQDTDMEMYPSPRLNPTSLTVTGNVTSPVRKTQIRTNERQLIDGRDFRDILEACRPRSIVTIPSSLKAFLRVCERKSEVSGDEECNQHDPDCPKEWGSLEFPHEGNTALTGLRRRTTHPSDHDSDERISPRHLSQNSSQDSEAGPGVNVPSIASSFESQVIRPLCAAQLQRSSSITLQSDREDARVNLGFSSNSSSRVSSDEEEVDNDNGIAKIENLLRTMMRNHDSAIVSMPPSPKLVSKVDQSRTDVLSALVQRCDDRITVPKTLPMGHTGSMLNRRQNHGTPAVSGGGLGAALTQYKFAMTNSKHFVPDADRGNTMLSRTTSLFGTTGQVSLRRNADMGSQGLSPLLLPSAAASGNAVSHSMDPQERLPPPDNITYERRFLTPQNYSSMQKSSSRLSTSITELSSASTQNDSNSRSGSPPTMKKYGSPPKDRIMRMRSEPEMLVSIKQKGWQRGSTPHAKGVMSRRKKLFNPFRQQDEDDVLAMKSHNRRRWSHVFPLGEVEFKRHAGPNWKSLTAPAILPISIDYFPKQEEIDHHFTTGYHNVALSEFEHKNFFSNKDLLVEMVRQRLTQDFQVIPDGCIDSKKYRMEPVEGGAPDSSVVSVDQNSTTNTMRFFLSMGHRLHTLTYYLHRDMIEVRRYTAKETEINYTVNYQYLSFCQETRSYSKCQQTFSKYTDQYNWNKVDNIICGDDDREMREGMRFKRIMFGIIPDSFQCDPGAEEAYVLKFRRFLEYLEKLRDKDESNCTPLPIKFVTSIENQNQEEGKRLESTPGVERSSMVRFYIQLRKGKRDNLEWMEVALDATFDTSWSYRIMFNWLVASSGKVDTQVQLLQRRCTQYGLRLILFPQVTVSKNVYLNPFKAPALLAVRHQIDEVAVDRGLCQIDFVYDGVFATNVGAILECLDDSDMFFFPRRRGSQIMSTMGKQFVHRSGTFFVRVLRDLNNLVIIVVLGNYRYMMSNKDESSTQAYRNAFQTLSTFITSL